jgi:hypothetical protein
MCHVAVHQRGLRQVIESQSASPVRAVGALTISPTMSASHQPVVRVGLVDAERREHPEGRGHRVGAYRRVGERGM